MKRFTLISLIFIFLFQLPSKSANPSKDNTFTVIIDAGHGGKDPGTTGVGSVYEKNLNLSMALKIKALLEKYQDIKVILTRDKDEFIELKDRGAIANRSGGDLFVSIHCNYKKSDEIDKNGFEIYLSDLSRLKESEYYTLSQNNSVFFEKRDTMSYQWNLYSHLLVPILQNAYFRQAERFGGIVELELTKETNLENRGLKQDAFFVLVGASMPSVLIETGFLSNKADAAYLKSDKGQSEISKAIYKSIIYYKMDYDFENNILFK